MGRRASSWLVPMLFALAVAVWGYATVRETVPDGLVMGQPAPDAVLVDLAGRRVRLSDLRGSPMILRFSSRTCAYCYDDFEFLEALQSTYGDGLRVVAIETGAPVDIVRSAVAGRNQSYLVLVDPAGAAAEAYRVQGLPQTYFVSADGRVLGRLLGELSDQDFRAHVAQILRPDGQVLTSLEAEVRAVAQQVRCQECQGLSVWQSQAPSAWEMRDEIRELLLSGLTRQEVLDELVARYGVDVLLSPPARGRLVWAYAIPFALIAIAAVLAVRLGRQGRAAGEEPPPVGEIDPGVEERIRKRLEEYL
ncbi:MAG: cytochrome c-type biogenesis protein CcmH [Firmicutes bacterium]|nr:cytochrome c-type biogenesis protein CcmH [Bacillota bacterium]